MLVKKNIIHLLYNMDAIAIQTKAGILWVGSGMLITTYFSRLAPIIVWVGVDNINP